MSLCRIDNICGQRSQKYEEVRFICVPAFLRYSQEFISCVRDKFNCEHDCEELVIVVFSRSVPLEHIFMTTCQISHTSPAIYTYLPTKHTLFVNATGYNIYNYIHGSFLHNKMLGSFDIKMHVFFLLQYPIYKSNIGSRYFAVAASTLRRTLSEKVKSQFCNDMSSSAQYLPF